VRIEYAPIVYSDLLLANGVYLLNPKLPSVIGGQGAGIVEAIEPGVTSVKVGDRVTIPFGTLACSEPDTSASRLPCNNKAYPMARTHNLSKISRLALPGGDHEPTIKI
jgi:Zn-dependent alcohol dehydrogenase